MDMSVSDLFIEAAIASSNIDMVKLIIGNRPMRRDISWRWMNCGRTYSMFKFMVEEMGGVHESAENAKKVFSSSSLRKDWMVQLYIEVDCAIMTDEDRRSIRNERKFMTPEHRASFLSAYHQMRPFSFEEWNHLLGVSMNQDQEVVLKSLLSMGFDIRQCTHAPCSPSTFFRFMEQGWPHAAAHADRLWEIAFNAGNHAPPMIRMLIQDCGLHVPENAFDRIIFRSCYWDPEEVVKALLQYAPSQFKLPFTPDTIHHYSGGRVFEKVKGLFFAQATLPPPTCIDRLYL